MRIPKFEVFAGHYGSADVMWKESVDGLGNAAERMRQFATKSPGAYFIFDTWSHRVTASCDTSRAEKEKKEAAG